MDKRTKIYEADFFLKRGIFIWRDMVEELWIYRELIWRLFQRDLRAKYKQSLLGMTWSIFMPLVAIGTFVLLNKTGILSTGDIQVPYVLFALLGLTIWQFFTTGLQAGTQSLVNAGDLITKVQFPREILIFSSLAQSIYDFLVKVVLLLILFCFYQYMPAWQTLLIPIFLLPIIFLTLGLSFLFSLLQGVIRDTVNVVQLGSTFLLFLTPVLYLPKPEQMRFFAWNPLTILIDVPRNAVLYGEFSGGWIFFAFGIISLLFCLWSWRLFHLVETKIPERL